MYYLVYGILYLVSLLPFFILYRISDFAFFLIYYVSGYRKSVVLNNLHIAFPEKRDEELKGIIRKFYLNLTDTFIETIKLMSISKKSLDKRGIVDFEVINKLLEKGLTLQIHSGHQMNWEYAHLVFAKKATVPWVGVYMQISNPLMNKLFLKIRSRFNAKMIAARDFTRSIRSFYGTQHMLALIGDQNPGYPKNAQWLYFFTKPAPFLASPEKGAIRNKTAVVFVNFIKIKRGYYRFMPQLITENAANFKVGELTLMYRDFLETCIRAQPDNYLWSHRRWKFNYEEELYDKWIDKKDPPIV